MIENNQLNWKDFWNNRAKNVDDFYATGRSSLGINGFLVTIKEIDDILKLQRSDMVLDVGCGTGIIAMALSPWVKEINCIDISEDMINRAMENCASFDNLFFSIGTAVEFEFKKKFDKILSYSVIQYLTDYNEIFLAFLAIKKNLKNNGIALYAANPDPEKRELYRNKIFHSTLSDVDKNNAIEMSEKILWIDKNIINKIAKSLNLNIKVLPINSSIWYSFYMYNLVITHE